MIVRFPVIPLKPDRRYCSARESYRRFYSAGKTSGGWKRWRGWRIETHKYKDRVAVCEGWLAREHRICGRQPGRIAPTARNTNSRLSLKR